MRFCVSLDSLTKRGIVGPKSQSCPVSKRMKPRKGTKLVDNTRRQTHRACQMNETNKQSVSRLSASIVKVYMHRVSKLGKLARR